MSENGNFSFPVDFLATRTFLPVKVLAQDSFVELYKKKYNVPI